MARILVPAIFVLFNKALSRSFASRTPPLVPLTDRLSIWLVSVGMVLVFLILILFMIQVEISRPKNTHPTESAWYCYTLPSFKILNRDRSGSVLPPTCHTALEQVISLSMTIWQQSLDQAIERTTWKKIGQRLLSGTAFRLARDYRL